MLYVVIILIALVLFLSAKLLLVKSQMKKVIGEMRNNPDKRQMNVDFVDGNLQDMIVEVNRLYEDIMQIKADGKEEERKMKESISMISHDMRTPLTSIIGYLQIAEKTEDRVEMTSNIEISLERARYLNKLVNDFFELSLIESDQVDIKSERVNLSEVICEEILAESPEIDKKGLEPSFEQAEQNIYVIADKKRLVRIIQNLISNAVKYSEKKLDFKIDSGSEGKLILSITTDSGVKIDVDRIFDRFYKQDSSRTQGGAGLGLYICKRFAEMMGGNISAEQDEENFIIKLELPVSE